jgi:hypothetical protein
MFMLLTTNGNKILVNLSRVSSIAEDAKGSRIFEKQGTQCYCRVDQSMDEIINRIQEEGQIHEYCSLLQ